MNSHETYSAIRHGGDVLRYHTHPTIGHQSAAHHTWNAVQLLLAVHPQPTLTLVCAVLHHDVAEGRVGDLTYPAKRRFPQLLAALTEAEDIVARELGLNVPLTGPERYWLQFVDMLEAMYYADDQVRLGNRNCTEVFRNGQRRCRELLDLLRSAGEYVEAASGLFTALVGQFNDYGDR